MGKDHLKRLAAPKSWPLLRKERTFITRPKPGRSFELAMSLNNIMKQVLTKGRTSKEVRDVINTDGVFVNGKRIYEPRLPVGFMDVISFPSIKENFMITLSAKGKLSAVKISDAQAKTRLTKISGKTRLAGKTQLNCYDSSNILVDKDSYKVGDSVVLEAGKIKKHLSLKEGATIMLTGGKHLALVGTVTRIDGNEIIFVAEKEELSTDKRYAFVVGEKTAEVTLR